MENKNKFTNHKSNQANVDKNWLDIDSYLFHKHYFDMLANEQLPPWLRDPKLSKDYQELLENRKINLQNTGK
jgi:hypothetical protein